MKVIGFKDIVNLGISPKCCYEWMAEALENKSQAILPAKISLKPSEGVFYNTMPVLIPTNLWGGVKLVTRYPDRNPSIQANILLYNLKTGENVALLDGTWITTMRTGAVSAHSINLFAKEDFSEIGFIGLGNTMRATLLVLLSLYPERPLHVKLLKYKNQHELFAERFKDRGNLTFSYVDTPEMVVDNSDVVVSAATYFDKDICEDKYFKEGVLLVPVHTRGFTNCDLFFDKVFADDRGHVKSFKYFDKFRSFAEVSDVVLGRKAGRESDKERIIAYNIGIALHDIYFASKIYELCSESSENITLDVPQTKFWV